MNKQLVAAAALALSVIASPAVAETTDWSGPYVGVYAGMNANETDVAGTYGNGSIAPGISGNSIAAGGTLGYNVQVDDSFVVGLEGDFGAGAKPSKSISSTYNLSSCNPAPGGSCAVTATSTWSSRLNWVSTIRARAGLASGDTLFYVTGGLALTDAGYSSAETVAGALSRSISGTTQSTLTGYAAGAGVEHRLGERVSVKAEYLRMAFPDRMVTGVLPAAGPLVVQSSPPTTNFRPTVNSLRLGVNYAF